MLGARILLLPEHGRVLADGGREEHGTSMSRSTSPCQEMRHGFR
ncbi:hypothetical protein HOU03_gp505 [Caulobacter phage CcrSC]|uniref:Uncharacterized protein n=1 Tax=Caulobacter phage CcrSC TaxID=2283272 RepID=A0A385EFW2_9CAUD|nr:hypothetical protein HOU03_gp505 [Caulobacter phage CcrSC]AXQ69762.1 hypothetical protein CcrSC_gp180c [Caulobacter phage CcrSC]